MMQQQQPLRPYSLEPWQETALRELIDHLNCLNNGYYEGPTDLGEQLARTAEAIKTTLEPTALDLNPNELVAAIATYHHALELATVDARHPGEILRAEARHYLRLGQLSAQALPPRSRLELVRGALAQLENLPPRPLRPTAPPTDREAN